VVRLVAVGKSLAGKLYASAKYSTVETKQRIPDREY